MHIPGNFTVTCSRHTSIRKSWGRGNHKYSFWGNEIITYLHNKVILARSVQHVKANPTLALISCLTFQAFQNLLKKAISAATAPTSNSPGCLLVNISLQLHLAWLTPALRTDCSPVSDELLFYSAQTELLPPSLWVSNTSFAPSSLSPTPQSHPHSYQTHNLWLRCVVPLPPPAKPLLQRNLVSSH